MWLANARIKMVLKAAFNTEYGIIGENRLQTERNRG